MCGRAAPLPFWVVQCFQSCAHAHRFMPGTQPHKLLARNHYSTPPLECIRLLPKCHIFYARVSRFFFQASTASRTTQAAAATVTQTSGNASPVRGIPGAGAAVPEDAPPAPPEGVPEEEDVSAEELLVPPEGAEEEEPPLSAPAFGCANTYRLRCVSSAFSRPSAVFAVSSSFSPSGLT